jgi:hypothetical protein
LKDGHKLQVSENIVLRKIIGSENEEAIEQFIITQKFVTYTGRLLLLGLWNEGRDGR